MLDETLDHLNGHLKDDKSLNFELIVIDDGSKDQTTRVAHEYATREGSDKIRVLKLAQNCGKGGAVKRGMLVARG